MKPCYGLFKSPVGDVYVVFSGEELAGISFEKPSMVRKGPLPGPFISELSGYFEGNVREFLQKTVFLEGTDFEKSVWLNLREVPYGETRTYKWLAERVGRPGAPRAVGRALSKNPIPIVYPCHRIIESDGRIGGYSPGVDIKRRLLDMEYYFSIQGSPSAGE